MFMDFPNGIKVTEYDNGVVEFSNKIGSVYIPKLEIKNLIRFLQVCDGGNN